jgi:hypothetical protein
LQLAGYVTDVVVWFMQVCKQFVLSPHDPQAAQAHVDECSELAAKLAKRVRDSSIECGICLEKVMSKTEMSQRRFGLMACEHAFCLACIRNWRQTGEVDTKTVSDHMWSPAVLGLACSPEYMSDPQVPFVAFSNPPAESMSPANE